MKYSGGFPLFLAAAAGAQDPGDEPPPIIYRAVATRASDLTGFVPKGWLLEAKALGDLNGDKLSDAALVLHMNDPRNIAAAWGPNETYDSNPRMLVIAFARRSGGYQLAVADHRLIPRLENQNQDEPFDEVKIIGGTLRVKMHLFLSAGGWRMGGSAYTFRWQSGGFKLIGFDRDSVMRNTGDTEEISINYLTGRKELKSGNIGDDKQRSRWVDIAKRPLLDLTEVGDGLMFDPDER